MGKFCGTRSNVISMSSTAFWRRPQRAVQAAMPIDQKIGDLYGSCMDEKAVDAKGIAPVQARARPHCSRARIKAL